MFLTSCSVTLKNESGTSSACVCVCMCDGWSDKVRGKFHITGRRATSGCGQHVF